MLNIKSLESYDILFNSARQNLKERKTEVTYTYGRLLTSVTTENYKIKEKTKYRKKYNRIENNKIQTTARCITVADINRNI